MQQIKIGKAPTNDIVINDKTVSREHLVVFIDDDKNVFKQIHVCFQRIEPLDAASTVIPRLVQPKSTNVNQNSIISIRFEVIIVKH